MRYAVVLYVSILLLASCQRSNILNESGNNGNKLISISSDSAGIFQFGYSHDTITSVSGNQSANIQFIKTGDTPCVSISYPGHTDTTKYFLNSFKLPTKIALIIDGVESAYRVDFFYQNGTALLDSAVVNEYGRQLIFKATYSGNNISQIQESDVYPTQSAIVATFNYTYSSENNIFRKTDSLLYIYSYIQPVLENQAMVSATFFAETFSASTFNSIHVSGITSNAFPNNQTSTMIPSVNKNGKIVAETFSDPAFESLAGKRYTYQ
jgi:hypothetical protein